MRIKNVKNQLVKYLFQRFFFISPLAAVYVKRHEKVTKMAATKTR